MDILEEKFAKYVTKVREVSETLCCSPANLKGMPTFFEHITVIAQMVFADEKVEIAILATGLGGRFDATTAKNAEIVAITPIDLDNTKILGYTIEEIAGEKGCHHSIRHESSSAPQKKGSRKSDLRKMP